MTLKDVCTIEALLGGTATTRAETADHRALVVREGMAVLVVLASKPFDVILAGRNGALHRTLILVCKLVSSKVLDITTASGDGASAFV
jgi:hypothetical protein